MGGGINKIVVWDTMLLFRVWTYINIEITYKNSWSHLKNWARFWDLKIFRIWDIAQKNQRNLFNFQDIWFLFLPWLSWAHLLAMAFMADLQGVILPNLFMNFSLVVEHLSLASFNWQTNILSQGKNSPALPALVILYKKNLESIKCQFLNSPLLFSIPYSNKDW